MNPFNFFFNPLQNQQPHSFNPFTSNFTQNIADTVRNALNHPLNPFGAFFVNNNQPQPQPNMGNIPNAPNVHPNHWNNSNNIFGGIFPNPPDFFNLNGDLLNNIPGIPPNVNVIINGAPAQGIRPNNQGQQAQQNKDQPKDREAREKSRIIKEAEKNTNSGHFYKKIGNEYFVKGLYSQALENYTRAIEQNNTESVFFSNRARCYKKLGDLQKAFEDVNASIELDDKNVKAHLLCGQILAELGKKEPGFEKLNKAIVKMQKAVKICNGQDKKDFEKDLEKNILKVRKIIWLKEASIKKQKKLDTLNYIKELINQDSDLTDDKSKSEKYKDVLEIAGNPLNRALGSVPDTFCCKITMDLMEDPVITRSGMTYEKDALNEHLNQRGNSDPVTREEIKPEEIYSNNTIKHAIQDFLKENPWAFESQEDEKYLDIKL